MEITLICEVDEELSVRDLSEFLVDLAFLYDRCVMLKENPRQPILYNPDFYRRWRRLPRGLQLKIRKISKDSPLEIVLTATTLLGAVMMFLKILNIKKEIDIKSKEIDLKNRDLAIKELEYLERLLKISKEFNIPPEQVHFLRRDLKKLLGSSIKIKEIR